MFESSYKKKQKKGFLYLKGEILIEDAGKMKELLVRHMKNVDDLHINVSEITQAHLSWFQLVCAAHKYGAKIEKKLYLDGEIPEHLKEMAVQSGFKDHKGCGCDTCNPCFWVWN